MNEIRGLLQWHKTDWALLRYWEEKYQHSFKSHKLLLHLPTLQLRITQVLLVLSWSVGRCNKSLWDLKECWYFSYQYLSKAQSVLCHCKRLQIKFIIWTSDSTPVLFAASTFVGPNALEQDSWKSFARRTCVILSWSVGRCNKSLWDLKECWYFSSQYLSKAQSVLCHCKRPRISFIIWALRLHYNSLCCQHFCWA